CGLSSGASSSKRVQHGAAAAADEAAEPLHQIERFNRGVAATEAVIGVGLSGVEKACGGAAIVGMSKRRVRIVVPFGHAVESAIIARSIICCCVLRKARHHFGAAVVS